MARMRLGRLLRIVVVALRHGLDEAVDDGFGDAFRLMAEGKYTAKPTIGSFRRFVVTIIERSDSYRSLTIA